MTGTPKLLFYDFLNSFDGSRFDSFYTGLKFIKPSVVTYIEDYKVQILKL